MCRLLKHIVWLVLVSISSCTDLLAVYKQDILLLKDVNNIEPEKPLSWDSLILTLPRPLSYPVGLTRDPHSNRLFVAEAIPNEEAKIFSVSVDSQYKVESMVAAVKSSHQTMIEGMSYNPRSKQLFWTEVSTHSILKASVSEKLDDEMATKPQLLDKLGVVVEPRGLAVDTCNEWLYWSERGGGGMNPSSVEMCDLRGHRHRILQQNLQENEYYQGLTYDAAKESLVMGVTVGDDYSTSSCRLIKQSVNGGQSQDLLTLKDCYPFALTVEDDFIYWADWAQEGIMRARASDPSSVIKLVHTPVSQSIHGKHYGSFGLVLMNTSQTNISNECRETLEKELEAEKMTGNYGESAFAVKHEKIIDRKDKEQVMNDETHHKEKESERMIDSGVSSKEKTSKQVINDQGTTKEGEIQPSMNSLQKVTEPEPETESPYIIGAKICNERQLIVIIILLAVFCVLFLTSTILLFVKQYYPKREPEGCKSFLPTVLDGTPAMVTQPRQVKRFGPKKRFNSGSKSGINGVSSCSGLSSGDGVSINIEDCCQMTLCETPCYTSVKKEGKSYKPSSKRTSNCDDKRGLLDNCEEI